MSFPRQNFLHDLSVATIIYAISNGAWNTFNQSLNSAETNNDDFAEPIDAWLEQGENTAGVNAFADFHFQPHVTRVLDVGGGKYDTNITYLKSRGVNLLVWDPYNRTQDHNEKVRASVTENQVDAATSMSVLNVIPECETRLAHIATVKESLVIGGMAYFKIWPGEEPYKGTYIPTTKDQSYQANAQADRFLREIEAVFGLGNVKLDAQIPNLIIATKATQEMTSAHDIKKIQEYSKADIKQFEKKRQAIFDAKAGKLLFSNAALSYSMYKSDLEARRHFDDQARSAYDKLLGVTVYKKS